MNRQYRPFLGAGLIPLPWYLFWSTLGGWQAQKYSAISQHVSELLANGGVPAICERIATIGAGACFVLFGLAVWQRSPLRFSFAAVSWIVFGVSMLSNGIWPMGSPLHGLYAVGIVNVISPAISHLELQKRLIGNGYLLLTLITSFCGVTYLWLNLTGFDPDLYRGASQRLFFSFFAIWPFWVAFKQMSQERRSGA
jgi:hypothetical protein